MSELIKKLEEEQKCVRDANFDSRTNFCTPEGYGFIKGFDYCLSLVEKNEQPQLNENQETVLGWLKAYADKDSGEKPFQAIFFMWDCVRSQMLGQKEFESLRKLTRQEQFEVLQAFGQWGMEELGDE